MYVYIKILFKKKILKEIFLRLFCFSCYIKVKELEIADKKKLKVLGLKSFRKRDKKSDSSVVIDSSFVCICVLLR